MMLAPTTLLVSFLSFTVVLASLPPLPHAHLQLVRRAKTIRVDQPKPALDTTAPRRSQEQNNATSSSFSQKDSIERVKQIQANWPWYHDHAVAADQPDSGDFLDEALTALASLDIPTAIPPNYQKTISPNNNKVPAAIRPKNRNYTLEAAFAEVAYCLKDYGLRGCGLACRSIPSDTQVLFKDGNGEFDPVVYVATTPSKRLLTVAYQGTNSSSIPSILNDALFLPLPLIPQLTPNNFDNLTVALSVPGTLAHIGFVATFARTYDGVLKAVKAALARSGPAKGYEILVTGHSLGGAIAQLAAIALRNDLTKEEAKLIKLTTWESPRVGNIFFANYLDVVLGNENHVHFNNQNDPVPHLLPSIALGYGTLNEMFFSAPDANGNPSKLVFCPGNDNLNCLTGRRSNFTFQDHLGPFFGIRFNSANCAFGL